MYTTMIIFPGGHSKLLHRIDQISYFLKMASEGFNQFEFWNLSDQDQEMTLTFNTHVTRFTH